MDINHDFDRPSRTGQSPVKPLDNPFRRKTPWSDREAARVIEDCLRAAPVQLDSGPRPYPLLRALGRWDAASGTNLALQLMVAGAVIHREADERRTAEYLLRHRREVQSGRRSGASLLRAARCAAEMDVRRLSLRERPTDHEVLALWAMPPMAHARMDDASVCDHVVSFLARVAEPDQIGEIALGRIQQGALTAMELADRHAANGGSVPSLLAMRPDARRPARLVTHLREAFDDDRSARAVARLLIGSDGTPIETALLWWAAQGNSRVGAVPPLTRTRWLRDLRAAGHAVSVTAA